MQSKKHGFPRPFVPFLPSLPTRLASHRLLQTPRARQRARVPTRLSLADSSSVQQGLPQGPQWLEAAQ